MEVAVAVTPHESGQRHAAGILNHAITAPQSATPLRQTRWLWDIVSPPVTAVLEKLMKRHTTALLTALVATGAWVFAQPAGKPMSPPGTAQVQVLGKWVKPERPA